MDINYFKLHKGQHWWEWDSLANRDWKSLRSSALNLWSFILFRCYLPISRSCTGKLFSYIYPCPLHLILSHHLSTYPISPYPWISSLVFLFSFSLVAPSWASFYQYHCPSSAHFQTISTWGVPLMCSFLIVPSILINHEVNRNIKAATSSSASRLQAIYDICWHWQINKLI